MNSLCPSLSGTELDEKIVGVKKDAPENQTKVVADVPLGRLMRPKDVANAALYFASDEGKFITGMNMEANGGMIIS